MERLWSKAISIVPTLLTSSPENQLRICHLNHLHHIQLDPAIQGPDLQNILK